MQTHAASAPSPAARLPATLAEIILPDSAGARRIARDIALIVAGSLVVALFAQIKVPLGFTPVPITGQTFAVLVVGALLGGWRGGLALALYAIEGAYLPFFTGAASRLVLDPDVGRLHRGIHTGGGAGRLVVPAGMGSSPLGSSWPCCWAMPSCMSPDSSS